MATAGKIKPIAMNSKTEPGKATQPNRVPLIFELSSEGRRGADMAPRKAGRRSGAEILGPQLCRDDLKGFPELSEPQVVRHFLRLAQGAFELMARLEAALAEITGMDAVSLHPAAGAQGELTGLLVMRAYHRKRGETRHKVIIPDTAHGTNPASCTLAGFEVMVARSNARGFIDAAEVKRLVSTDVAAMMVTNPNTIGVFEPEICEIAKILHDQGALLYMDGANMNALMGV